MVASAVRIAQRMGLDSEASYSTTDSKALDCEMRRRLWWSLTMFDHRLCEMISQERSTSLTPAWDCRLPANLNDFEMQPDMTEFAISRESTTEALFAVVRSELADWTRKHSSLLGVTSTGSESSSQSCLDLDRLEIMMLDKHLGHCNPQVSLHFLTVWTTRAFFARSRLMEHYTTHAKSASEQPTTTLRNQAHGYAINMLECDTQLRNSPLVRKYLWLVESLYSPILTYFHLLNGLLKRPGDEMGDHAWGAMAEHYEALVNGPKHHRTRVMFALKFSRLTVQAWEARVEWKRQHAAPAEKPPRLVLDSMPQELIPGPTASMEDINFSPGQPPWSLPFEPSFAEMSNGTSSTIAPTLSPEIWGDETSSSRRNAKSGGTDIGWTSNIDAQCNRSTQL